MKKLDLYNLFYIFIFSSIAGWVVEGLWSLIIHHTLINHSAVVIGPFDFAYGLAAICLTTFLIKLRDSHTFKIFIVSFIGGSIVEYIMSWGMELVLGFTAWDYTGMFLNINGRITLLFSIFWGLLGVLWIKVLYPLLEKIISKINRKTGEKIIFILGIFLICDIVLTFSAIARARDFDKGIKPKNTYEVILDKTFNTKYLKNMFNNFWE